MTGLTARHAIQKGFSFINEKGQNDCAPELAETSIGKKPRTTLFCKNIRFTGAKTLFVNAAFTEEINELAAEESGAMLCNLYSRITNRKNKRG